MLERNRTSETRSSPPPLDAALVALFLDLDGTLAEIAPRPDDVGPDARLTRILEQLCALMKGRVAVLTGRTLDDVDRILAARIVSVAAVHGLIRRLPDGSVTTIAGSPRLVEARRLLAEFGDVQPGLILEDKGVSIALHYRQVPHAQAAVQATTERIARATGLVVQDGSMVSELRTAGPDKGDSLKAYLNAPPFAGHVPIMVGDDLTDEHGFAAATEMGGYGVLVGHRPGTAARYRLGSVNEVRAWLSAATHAHT